MKNRAKCKICKEVLESFHTYDYVSCKCGEVSISGGQDKFECSAKNWGNFLRIDDEGNEIIPKIVNSEVDAINYNEIKITRKDRIAILEEMVKYYESLPEQVFFEKAITHSDLHAFGLVILEILKSE